MCCCVLFCADRFTSHRALHPKHEHGVSPRLRGPSVDAGEAQLDEVLVAVRDANTVFLHALDFEASAAIRNACGVALGALHQLLRFGRWLPHVNVAGAPPDSLGPSEYLATFVRHFIKPLFLLELGPLIDWAVRAPLRALCEGCAPVGHDVFGRVLGALQSIVGIASEDVGLQSRISSTVEVSVCSGPVVSMFLKKCGRQFSDRCMSMLTSRL
jgi:hypothetical protein